MRPMFWRIAFFLGAISAILGGCATAPVVTIQECIIPEELDYVASGPADIPADRPLPSRDALTIWAGDRHLQKSLADDYNDLVNHVKRECQ